MGTSDLIHDRLNGSVESNGSLTELVLSPSGGRLSAAHPWPDPETRRSIAPRPDMHPQSNYPKTARKAGFARLLLLLAAASWLLFVLVMMLVMRVVSAAV